MLEYLENSSRRLTGKAERLLAWTAILYGLAILNPSSDVFGHYFGYGAMNQICASESAWGFMIAASGVAQWVAWKRHSRIGRRLTSAAASMMWMSLSALFVLGGLTSKPLTWLTAVTSPGVLLFTAWAVFQVEIFIGLRKR